MIVDSPGIGENTKMDEVVIQYLPEAFAFIYVINTANAGGVQEDRVSTIRRNYRSTSHRRITAVSDNTRPVMSKTSLDFGFFCDVNQSLKN